MVRSGTRPLLCGFAWVSGRIWVETMIRLSISVAFALAIATSAEAMSPAPLHEPGAEVTHIADGQPCDLPNQVQINGICQLRTTPPVRQRGYRRCVEWNEGMCVEYYGTLAPRGRFVPR